MIRLDENASVLAGTGANAFRHVFRSLYLYVHIACPCLDGTAQAVLANTCRLDFRQGRIGSHDFGYTAGSHQRHIGFETCVYLIVCQRTSVQTYFGHLRLLQNLQDLRSCLVLYGSANHNINVNQVNHFVRFMLPEALSVRSGEKTCSTVRGHVSDFHMTGG